MPTKLAQVMQQKGFTARTLARQVDLSESYINLLARGKRKPSIQVAYAICRALGEENIDIFLPDDATNSSKEQAATSDDESHSALSVA